MTEPIKLLYDEMREKLSVLENVQISASKRLSGKLDIILAAIELLKKYVASEPFKNETAEIEYFKYEKPLFVCEQLITQSLFNIETRNHILAEPSLIHNNYEQELTYTRHFFAQHQFLYNYFLLEATELDGLLFIRGAETSSVILPETPDLNLKFSTKGDYIFSRFIAYERIQEFLTRELYPAAAREKFKNALNWTGDKSNLIEIAYGIYDTAQINRGEVDIKDIILWLEDSLNISLSRHYRLFAEMKDRKLVSPTRYLDHMGEMVRHHLTDGDAFRPQIPKSVSGSKSKVIK